MLWMVFGVVGLVCCWRGVVGIVFDAFGLLFGGGSVGFRVLAHE